MYRIRLALAVILIVLATVALWAQVTNPRGTVQPGTPPTLASLSVTTGQYGTVVTVTGTGFGASQVSGAFVSFNGLAAPVSSWADTSIAVTVPVNATSGSVTVIEGGAPSNAITFTIATPAISGLSVTSGVAGDPLTVTGTNFGTTQGLSRVTFNGTVATVTSWASTSLVTTVPAGATTGPVIVTLNGLASAGVTFTVSGGVSCTTTISSGSNLATSISALAGGGTLCLNSGTYSTGMAVNGMTKSPRVTIRSVTGQGATLDGLAIGNASAVSGLTFDHLTFSNTLDLGVFAQTNRATNITVSNSNLDGVIVTTEEGNNANILYDHDTFRNTSTSTAGVPARFLVETSNTAQYSGVTIQYSYLYGIICCSPTLNTDALRFDQGGLAYRNEIDHIIETNGANHTDSSQCYQCGSGGYVLRENYFHQGTDATALYDGSTNTIFEGNIIDMTGSPNGTRPWGIECYACVNAIIRHNTVLYQSQCDPGYGTVPCGIINFDTKGPAGSLQVYDNIGTRIDTVGSQVITSRHHNLLRTGATGSDISGSPTYTGGSFPTTAAGFVLAGGSLGKNAASDGLDVGATYFGPYYSVIANPNDVLREQVRWQRVEWLVWLLAASYVLARLLAALWALVPSVRARRSI